MAKYQKFKRIINEVTSRWRDTITGANPIDLDKAKQLLRALDKNAKIFVVDSPSQFYVGQAVMRGRVAKKNVQPLCDALKIDSAFINDLQICGGTREIMHGHRWYRHSPMNVMDVTLRAFMEQIMEQDFSKSARRRFRGRAVSAENRDTFSLCNLHDLYNLFVPSRWDQSLTESQKRAMATLHHRISYQSPRVERSQMTLAQAVSNNTEDLISGDFNSTWHMYDAVHAEIIAKAMNVKDLAVTAHHEIFHYVPAMMQFRRGFLLLGKRPEIKLNAEGLMHNDAGPAVSFENDRKFWFIDGHMLAQQGEKIVLAPETLTPKEIADINNEEERRIAIDRFGWGKYLQDGGGKVMDYRENWVDNTVEVLIKPPKAKTAYERNPLRMVLACRSTGRKYFIAVPPDRVNTRTSADSMNIREDDPEGRYIRTCEMAQSWFANGGTCEHLPYANKELNIIGAS